MPSRIDAAPEQECIHVIDDDEGTRVLIERLLGTVGLRCVLWDRPATLLAAANEQSIHVLVVDIRLTGMSGLVLVRSLRDRGVTAPVIFISGIDEVPVAIEAMRLGAYDFLPKPFAAQALLDAVQAALRQHRADSDRTARLRAAQDLLATLSPRERQVLLAIVDGKANKVVAADLGLSEKTVEDHRGRLMAKLGASSVADLVKLAIHGGLCDPASWTKGSKPPIST